MDSELEGERAAPWSPRRDRRAVVAAPGPPRRDRPLGQEAGQKMHAAQTILSLEKLYFSRYAQPMDCFAIESQEGRAQHFEMLLEGMDSA